MSSVAATGSWRARLARFAPGLVLLASVEPKSIARDAAAGVAAATVIVPVGIAYAPLVGVEPIVGLYASIFPLLAYAIFGSSRQLIVGPDAATCAMLGAAAAPAIAASPDNVGGAVFVLTMLTGVFCVVLGLLRLGALADFVSRPVLLGYVHGVALTIAAGQLDEALGVPISAHDVVGKIAFAAMHIGEAQLLPVTITAGGLAVLFLLPKVSPRLPAALIATVLAAILVLVLGLEERGAVLVGAVPSGLPPFGVPSLDSSLFRELWMPAIGVAIVSFSNGILVARTYATKQRYDIDSDKELIALGAANAAAAVTGGFAVSGTMSRTGAVDAAGGRSQVAGLTAAVIVFAVAVGAGAALAPVPVAVLAAVLLHAAYKLVDARGLVELWRLDKFELVLSLFTTVGVLALGIVEALAVAIGLALLYFVRATARPRVEVLGTVPGVSGFHAVDRHPEAEQVPGIALFRFNAPIQFFNAAYFKREALRVARAAGPGLRFFVIDLLPVPNIDATGAYTIRELREELGKDDVVLVCAGRMAELASAFERRGITPHESLRMFPTLRRAFKTLRAELHPSEAIPETPAAESSESQG